MVFRYRPKPNGSVRIWPTLKKQSSVRYTHYLQWMRTSLDWKIVAYSPNLMSVVFGIFFWMPNQNCSQRFGRFCFNRVPFGVSSASEIFQSTMSKILEGLERTLCQMDDVLIHGVDQPEHDGHVRAVLHLLQEAGLTLNNKCEFSCSSIRFLAHIIDSSGLHADPQKTTAPFRCLRDTAIHGNAQPPWKFYSQLGWPRWPPLSIITQGQCLGLGWIPAKSRSSSKR